MRIHVAESADDVSLAAAHEFARITTSAVELRGRCFVALSGGSTPRGLNQALARTEAIPSTSLGAGQSVPWSGIEFFWSDERHVPPDHADSNYKMAYDTLLSKVPVAPAQVHRVRAEGADAAIVAREYEQEIRTIVPQQDGTPRFDLILLGLGADGHTASLFPATAALHEQTRLCVDNWVPHLSAHRITMTLPLLNAARAVCFLVSGAEKASIVRGVLQPTPSDPEYPARLVQPSGELTWMLDRGAANQLRT
jgi:6-phosphogluconolactonase